MEIRLNGEKKDISINCKVDELIKDLSLDPRSLVVELNQTIITHQNFADTGLAEGDNVEIIRFIGGG